MRVMQETGEADADAARPVMLTYPGRVVDEQRALARLGGLQEMAEVPRLP